MKVVLDTNVLVRYLVWDDEQQALASAEVIETADEIIIPSIVLCETMWVLTRAYRYAASDTIAALRCVIEIRNVTVDRPAAEAGFTMFLQGGDFADGVIAYEAERNQGAQVVTFDQTFARLATPGRVRLLAA